MKCDFDLAFTIYFLFVGSKPQTTTESGCDEFPKFKHASPDPNLYTVRVYRSSPQATGDRLAIICVSLYGRLYAKVGMI